MLAIVAPGQGAQTPGFLAPWLELPSVDAKLDWFGAVTGLDLKFFGTDAGEDDIRDTAIAQPLLEAAALLAAAELFDGDEAIADRVGVVAGHSVGEIAAGVLAGVCNPEAAMVLVTQRGRAMAKAAALAPTSMTAVIGGKPDQVLAAIEAAGCTPANNNGSGQIVAAGTVEQLEQLAQHPPERARLIPLSVAGAFHTHHMQTAVATLQALEPAIEVADPRVKVLSNADGQVVTSGADYLRRLVNQVENPVRWDLCLATMADLGVTGLLELTPAGTLTGIAKRNLKGVELFSLNTPDQLDDARTFVASHGHPADGDDPAARG